MGSPGPTAKAAEAAPTQGDFFALSRRSDRGERPVTTNVPSEPLVATASDRAHGPPQRYTTAASPSSEARTAAPSTGLPSGPVTRPWAENPAASTTVCSIVSPSRERTTRDSCGGTCDACRGTSRASAIATS